MKHLTLGLFTVFAAGRIASAQTPAVSKAGKDALIIELVGSALSSLPVPATETAAGGPASVVDTTPILVGRDEVKRFVVSVHKLRDAQLRACGRLGQTRPTLGSDANQWFLRVTCERASNSGPLSWGLLYAGGPDGAVKRAATIGSTAELDAWMTRLAALVAGPRPIRLKS